MALIPVLPTHTIFFFFFEMSCSQRSREEDTGKEVKVETAQLPSRCHRTQNLLSAESKHCWGNRKVTG